MILCITANPCLDKTLDVPAWRPGDNIRGTAVRNVVGGKGNNVARALARLGRKATPGMFLGGAVGDVCRALLVQDDGLDPRVVPTIAPTRVILTVRGPDNGQTAFFDPDPAVTDAEAGRLVALVAAELDRGGVEALTLSGSSPAPATHGLYADLVALARDRRVPVFVDTYGPMLATLIERGAWPDALQLNRREASIHLGRPDPGDADLDALVAAWAEAGVGAVVITDGPGAVRARIRGETWVAHPPEIEPVNPIGSGDCLHAGLVDGWLGGREPAEILRHAVAAAVANALVWDAGDVRPELVARVAPQVRISGKPGP